MLRRRRRRPIYIDLHLPTLPARAGRVLVTLLVLSVVLAFIVQASLYLRELSCSMAISDATDMMTVCINDTVSVMMADSDYDYDYFVTLERDSAGGIAAVSTNMARINSLSSELLKSIIKASDSGKLNLDIPVGNLLGSSLLLGRGPTVPVEITMLTSSHIDLKNELDAAGINQTKHQIKLDVVIDIDVILPWNTVSTEVVSEILVAETVIVGQVPQTYFNVG
ncbi:MAG: sporulation protein YunB [Oscillospiraceae bacterium]